MSKQRLKLVSFSLFPYFKHVRRSLPETLRRLFRPAPVKEKQYEVEVVLPRVAAGAGVTSATDSKQVMEVRKRILHAEKIVTFAYSNHQLVSERLERTVQQLMLAGESLPEPDQSSYSMLQTAFCNNRTAFNVSEESCQEARARLAQQIDELTRLVEKQGALFPSEAANCDHQDEPLKEAA
ncbi:hypothetical protein AB833_06515 [Chromatiales bacterium (ex Bugula neritina AB1)]|nr:hypothetical protein AB833_06515 [Chromatiales bacterium (ex Bugula neritina AB1)]